MELRTIIIIALAVIVVLFVPFYPFRLVKRLVFYLLNTFVPLKFKFDDIGGVPIVGIRLFNVRIALKGQSTLEARELRLRINLWKILLLSRPTVDPVTLIDPKIEIYKEKEHGDFWLLLPFNVAKRVVGMLFANLWGLNKVRIRNGEITIHGKQGDTRMTNLEGLFYSLGGNTAVRYMICRIGEGTIEMTPVDGSLDSDIKVTVRNLQLNDLVALKVPKHMAGVAEINAIMEGGFKTAMSLNGEMKSPCIYLREQPIRNFHAPLHFSGTTLTLAPMRGEVGDYVLTGSLDNDVETDKVNLKLHGTGHGRGPAYIFRMLNLKPYLSDGGLDGKIDLFGDFEIFDDITGPILLRLTDARISPEMFSKNEKPGRALPKIPIANIDFFMQEGSLYIESVEAFLPGSKVGLKGRIDMVLDEEIERVTQTHYDLEFSVKKDNTVRHHADSQNALTIPGEFDGKFKLTTNQRLDPSDFHATGGFELNNILIQTGKIELLSRFGGLLDVFLRSVKGELEINAKRVLLKQVHLDGVWMHLLVNGEIGLDGALDLIAAARIVSSEWEDSDRPGFLKIPMKLASHLKAGAHITGNMNKPKVRFLTKDKIN